jgi:two-component sensor histidine kinase
LNNSLTRYEARSRRRNANLYALFAAVAILVSGVFGLTLPEWQFGLMILCILPVLALVPVLNGYGKDAIAVAILVHASNFSILTFNLGYGHSTGSHAYIFPVLVAIANMNPFPFYQREFWTHVGITVGLHGTVFLLDKFFFTHPTDLEHYAILESINYALAILMTLIIVFKQNNLSAIAKLKLGNQWTQNASTLDKLHNSIREKEVLLAEVHHRVKNNLAIISGMLNLRRHIGAKGQNVDMVLQECANRVVSMALVHEKLYKSGNLSNIPFHEYLEQLCQDIQDSLIHDQRIQLYIETEEIYLTIEKAIPAGLIVNEIVTNSIKHAFQGRESGQIHVHLMRQHASVYLLIKDDGVGIQQRPDTEKEESLGFLLVDSLVNQLDGTYEFVTHNGTSFMLRFPI